MKLHCYLLIARFCHGRVVGRLGRTYGWMSVYLTVVAVRLCVGRARGSGHGTRLVVTSTLDYYPDQCRRQRIQISAYLRCAQDLDSYSPLTWQSSRRSATDILVPQPMSSSGLAASQCQLRRSHRRKCGNIKYDQENAPCRRADILYIDKPYILRMLEMIPRRRSHRIVALLVDLYYLDNGRSSRPGSPIARL